MEVGLPLRVADVVVVSVLLCDDDGDGDTNVDVDAVVVEVDEATAVSDVDGVVVVAAVVVGVIDLDGDAVDDDVAVEVVLTVRDVVDVPLSEGENELVPVVEIDALDVEADEAVWDIDEDTDDDMDDERLIEALDVGLPLRVADAVVVSVLLCDDDGDGDTSVAADAVVVEVDEATAVRVIDLDGNAVDDDVAVEVVLTVRDVVDVPLSEGENELVPVVEIDALDVEADEAVWDIDEDTDDDMDDERLIEALDVGLPLREAEVVMV